LTCYNAFPIVLGVKCASRRRTAFLSHNME